jgi:hypothetical protein
MVRDGGRFVLNELVSRIQWQLERQCAVRIRVEAFEELAVLVVTLPENTPHDYRQWLGVFALVAQAIGYDYEQIPLSISYNDLMVLADELLFEKYRNNLT